MLVNVTIVVGLVAIGGGYVGPTCRTVPLND